MTDEFAYLRGAVNRAAAMQREINELVAPTTDRGDLGPYTEDDYEALAWSIWSLQPDEDPGRFEDLLHALLAFVGRLALDGEGNASFRAARLLRSMQLRVLNGPDHPVRQP